MRNTYAKTMAHELGHGLFGLDHTFISAYGLTEGYTNNLMDYTTKTPDDFLSYHEWAQINQPVASWSLFNSDEDNMYVPWSYVGGYTVDYIKDENEPNAFYTVAVSDGTKFALPSNATNLRFSKEGYLLSFVLDNELWEAFHESQTGKHDGFYKDLTKKVDKDGVHWMYDPKKNKPYTLNPTDENFVYIPIFVNKGEKKKTNSNEQENTNSNDQQNVSSDHELCYQAIVYKAPYSGSTIDELKTKYAYLKDSYIKDTKLPDDYRIVYGNTESYSCMDESVQRLYMFLCTYYNSVSKDEVLKNKLLEVLRHCGVVRVYGKDEISEDNLKSSEKLSLSSNKDMSVDVLNSFMEQIYSGKTQSRYTITVTFDNYSVYEDYYLKQFSDGESKCSQKQWESDLTQLDNFYKAVKNSESQIKVGNETIENPDIYDFCNHITKMCHDYLHTVKYEIIEQYLRLIVDHCSGKNQTGFSFATFLHRFDDRAEKASLWLMRAIDKSDYGKFAKFMAENNNGVLFGYMKKFDDAHVTAIFPCDGNNYTKFMRVLVTMFRANPAAFINTDPKHCKSEKDIIIMKNYKSNYDKNDETGLCHLDIKNEDGNKFFNEDGLSPFTQIYFVIDKENAPQSELVGKFDEFKLDEEVYKKLGIEVEADVFLISCPLVFLQYYEDKENVDLAENVAIGAGVVVGAVALAALVGPELMLFIAKEGVSVASKWVATRYGQKGMLNFTVGAFIEGTSYMLGQEFSQIIPPSKDEINTTDLLYHMVIGGFSNMFENKWALNAFTCVQAMDFSSIYTCLTSESDEYKGCSFKLAMECGSAILLDRLFSNAKIHKALYGALGGKVINKFIDKFGPVPMKLIMTLYAKINKTKNPSLVDDILDLHNKYGLKGFSLLADAEFPFENLGKDALEGVFKAMYKDQSQNTYKNLKGLLSKNYESIAPLLGMLNKVEKPSGFSNVIEEIWKKAKKFEVRDKTTGVNVKLKEILDNPLMYTKELKVFSKFDEKTDLMTYRYILLGQVVECQVKSVSSGVSNVVIKLLDDAYDWLRPLINLQNNQITDDGYELQIYDGIQDEG